MNFKACLDDQIGRLVHPAAHVQPAALARHRLFIITRLSVAFAALAAIPVYLVAGGVPGRADALVLLWLVVPLLAVLRVSRTGDLAHGVQLSLVAWLGLGTTLAFGRVCGLGPATAVLFLIPVEATLWDRVGWAKPATALALGLGALLTIAAGTGVFAFAAPTAADIVFYAFAAVYGGVLATVGADQKRVWQQAGTDEALRFRSLADAVGDLVLRLDRGGTVLLASPSAEGTLGLAPADLLGRRLFERVHVADRPAFLTLVSDAAAGARSLDGNVRLRTGAVASQDGGFAEPTFAWVELRLRGIARDGIDTGADREVLAVLRDITARVAHETAIEQAAREAADASAWKDRFLATVSHELRTPLNAIIGFGEILASEAHTPQDGAKRREYAEIIHTSGRHLLAVVNSLLDMSKIEAGKFDLDCERFDVGALIATCCDMVRLKAEQSRIDLVRDIDPALPDLLGDKRACRQIVINLLSNALKFTPEYGSVSISARLEGEMLAIAVADTGIGMLAPDMARLGDPFFQAQNSYDRRYEGTGLGLSVVRGLVGLHGGTIAAESTPGEGTRMTIRLPRNGGGHPAQVTKATIEVMAHHSRPLPTAAAAPHLRKVQRRA